MKILPRKNLTPIQTATDLELQALWFHINQSVDVIKGGKAALGRLAARALEERRYRRRVAIFNAGFKAKTPNPRLNGEQLEGSLEHANWFNGYRKSHPDYQNPYRSR